ncbi:hypothetical protein [Salana multivorans]
MLERDVVLRPGARPVQDLAHEGDAVGVDGAGARGTAGARAVGVLAAVTAPLVVGHELVEHDDESGVVEQCGADGGVADGGVCAREDDDRNGRAHGGDSRFDENDYQVL